MSLEAEQAVLGCVLKDPDCLEDVDLPPEAFEKQKHRIIYRAMLGLSKRGDKPDFVCVSDYLRTAEPDIPWDYPAILLATISATANMAGYVNTVKESYQRRELVKVGREIIADAKNIHDLTSVELLAKAEERLYLIGTHSVRDEPIYIGEVAEPIACAFINKEPVEEGSFLLTRIGALNEKITGLFKGELCLVGAEPGQGKSSFAIDFCLFNGGCESLYIAFDETRRSIAERGLIAQTGVHRDKLRKRQDITDADVSLMQGALNFLSGQSMAIYDEAGIDIDRVLSVARRWQRKHGLDVLVVDFVQQTERNSSKMESEVIHLTHVARRLKQIAKELNIIVIGVSQLSKKPLDAAQMKVDRLPKPHAERLLGTGAFQQEANLILMPWRPWAYCDEHFMRGDPRFTQALNKYVDAATRAEVAGINVAKNKMGPTGWVECSFAAERMRFEEGVIVVAQNDLDMEVGF